MACLALSLQPANGPDLLLQTREWFPPARALTALSAFRQTRLSFRKHHQQHQHQHQDTASPSPSLLGDDPLAASSGQVVVGTESRFLVVYRLVNSVYVLGVSPADPDPSLNVFECIHTVNQAVSVVVAACRGVDVTPEKLSRKYPELYMALDLVLRGQVGPLRLSALLASIHGDSLAKMLLSGLDSESRARGALLPWSDPSPHDRSSTRSLLSSPSSSFELPPETLAAGDEVRAEAAAAASSLPSSTPDDQPKPAPEDHPSSSAAPDDSKDPFAASDALNKPPEEALVGGFKKTADSSSADPASALALLDVTALPTSAAAATKPTFIGVEGFEGDYGGIEYGNEGASLSETFEGFDDAFGGGLDPSEFVGTDKKAPGSQGLGGLELLATSSAPDAATSGVPPTPPPALEGLLTAKPTERKGPEMHIEEEISAEFRESLLVRVALQGVVYLRTLPPPVKTPSEEVKETEFSFRYVGTSGVKRVAVHGSRASSLGNGLFHIRTAPSDEVLPVLKYSLQPRFTPIPLRVRLLQRHLGTLLSVLIQYASNPELPQPLSNVTFKLKLPVDPTLLTVSPKGVLDREERELRWHVDEIPLKGPPGKLRARMPVDQDAGEGEEVEVVGTVTFSVEGASTLSGVSIQPATEGKTDFYMVNHRYATKNYLCN